MKQQNEEIAALAVTLATRFPTGFCMVASIDCPARNTEAGAVKEVGVQRAAELIVEKTHKLATPDEIEAYRLRR